MKQTDSAPAAPKLATPAAGSLAPRASLEPLSPQRYRLQLTLSRDTHDKLLRAQGLLRHRLPDGDLSQVLDEALELLCAKLEARKFGKKRVRPGSVRPAAPAPGQVDSANDAQAPEVASPAAMPEPPPSPVAPTPRPAQKEPSRHIPAAVRRVVSERDGHRCTFVSPEGRRCEAQAFLEFHHDPPFARVGGARRVRVVRPELCRHALHRKPTNQSTGHLCLAGGHFIATWARALSGRWR
jgi:hypothetical protein